MKKILFFGLFILLAACTTSKVTNEPAAISKEQTTEPIYIALVSTTETENTYKEIGCDEFLYLNQVSTTPISEDRVMAALDALFIEPDTVFRNSTLVVNRVADTDGILEVGLVGEYSLAGVCDEPRFEEQILETIRANKQTKGIEVYLNDGLLFKS